MNGKAPIFLIGLPGSGKTTLGRALAREANLQFIDLDLYIQGRFSCSISDLFARKGEEAFRTIEHNMLHEVAEMQDVVIACGGGTPCFFDNMDYILSRGVVIHLIPSQERLLERLWRGRARRPAISQLSEPQIAEYIDKILAERTPVYERAHLTIESSQLEDKASIQLTAHNCITSINNFTEKQRL